MGATGDDDGGMDRGALWVLFLNSNGTVKGHQKISDTAGGFTGILGDFEGYGSSLALVRSDAPGEVVVAVGALADDDGGADKGAVWQLTLGQQSPSPSSSPSTTPSPSPTSSMTSSPSLSPTPSSTTTASVSSSPSTSPTASVSSSPSTSPAYGAFVPTGTLEHDRLPLFNQTGGTNLTGMGSSVSVLGDLDGNGYIDLAFGSNGSAFVALMANGSNAGARVHSLVEHRGASVDVSLMPGDGFGISVAGIRGLGNNSDFLDLAVGATGADMGRGAVYMLFLRTNGSIYEYTKKIAPGLSGFTGSLAPGDAFGASISLMGDFNYDGQPDLCVGALGDDGGGIGPSTGAVWLLSLESRGFVVAARKITAIHGLSSHPSHMGAFFGSAVAGVPGSPDMIAVGAEGQDPGGLGAVFLIRVNATGDAVEVPHVLRPPV